MWINLITKVIGFIQFRWLCLMQVYFRKKLVKIIDAPDVNFVIGFDGDILLDSVCGFYAYCGDTEITDDNLLNALQDICAERASERVYGLD